MKTWSSEEIENTREALEDVVTYTSPDGRTHWVIGEQDFSERALFKNIDGNRFGIMTVENADRGKFIIKVKSGGEESYSSIDDLLNAGWVVDL
jgi:hypothetical protein